MDLSAGPAVLALFQMAPQVVLIVTLVASVVVSATELVPAAMLDSNPALLGWYARPAPQTHSTVMALETAKIVLPA